MNMRNWSISTKLIAAFAVNMVIVVAMMTVVWNSSATVQATTERSSHAQDIYSQTVSFEMAAQRMNSQVRGYVITSDESYARFYKEANGQMADALAAIDRQIDTPTDQALVDETRVLLGAWQPLWATRLMKMGDARRNEEAMQIIRADVKAQLLSPVLAPLRKLRTRQTEALEEYRAEQAAAFANSERATLVGTLLLAISVIGLCILLTRAIGKPITKLTGVMKPLSTGDFSVEVPGTDREDEVGQMAKAVAVFRENGIAKDAADRAKAKADTDQKMVVDTVSAHLSDLSNGDLTAAINAAFPPEYDGLKRNFNEALGRLRDLIGAVSESASSIRTGSGEIAQASEDLARRTESNAASLEETAASVTQMDGRLKASVGAASRTVQSADRAIATIGGGRAMADEAVQAMGRVSECARGIDTVIEGLDKIAFQTRVLAMNAAVEAGRAGDAGRGFAVVADLVSALAMRAEEEAKRARDQLTMTQSEVVIAVDAVTKVDDAFGNISGDVAQVHELLATMASDNQAQSAAITEISTAIGTMDQSTQQNAAMVEQTSAAARNLASEVGNLADQAARFRTGDAAGNRKPDYAKRDAYVVSPQARPAVAAQQAKVPAGNDWNAF